MSLKRIPLSAILLAGLLIHPGPTAVAEANCPFCSAPSLTLAEQLSQADAAALVMWVDAKKAREQDGKRLPSKTTYEIRQVVRNARGAVKTGDRVSLSRFRSGKKGDLFLLLGSKATKVEWGSPLPITETSYQYIVQAPSPEAPAAKRLAYFMRFLEFPDRQIADDAYAEFANAPYKDISSVRKLIPRKKVLRWITNSNTPPTRTGLYGLLMGLSGNASDAALMRKLIASPTEEFRLGIDGVISGYLLLAGEKGLPLIEQLKLKNQYLVDENGKVLTDKKGRKKLVPFSETYASMQALRFMWTYGDSRIAKERLRKSMRILLERPELADLVIADLARWKDWSIQDRLMAMYNAKDYNVPAIKRAIVRYMLVSTKDVPKGTPKDAPAADLPKHVQAGQVHLATLRKKDPKTVRDAERFFFLK
ncbi:MAG: hypothetical protein VB859_07140 [Planctomycetaceae bacterium]